ncbi:threonine aldolase family protein [Microvirga thermotolerans]|uniref:L-threonine aldolase n=1 Tax=Microvirga thermotolerans TaxID=2651334 RepID=A0A5P9JZP9_9HYPH|nr:low specificity L-threonine aldolase [Microvirga thermotolerans]QFU15414.1 low specificity L-threonine aldolase [Microvirga thermotolerans]
MNFVSDNVVGASAPVMEALARANGGAMAAYGADEIARRVKERFAELFEREVAVFLVTTGTAANALALSSAVPPWGLCVCHREAHVIDDECGAPEFFMHGAKLVGLPGAGAKLDAGAVGAYLEGLPKSVKQMPPKALSISQATECGTVYRPEEIAALGALCRDHGMALHMDGARFANALVSLGCTPAEMTWKQGVDILSFGATKNGCLMAEAVVVFRPDLAESLAYRAKRAGQVISKGRLISAQLEGYFAADHWLDNARHANRMARLLAEGLMRLPGVRLAWPVEANEVFPVLPRAASEALRAAGAGFMEWTQASLPEGETIAADEALIRLVMSYATQEEEVRRFLQAASTALSRQAAE